MITPGFYGVLDVGIVTRSFLTGAATAFARAGAPTVLLRAKALDTRALMEAARLVGPILREASTTFLINDRADIALIVGADGVHLGQADLDPADARALLGPDAIIGTSTHDLAQLEAACAGGACDYVAFGPVFAGRTKQRPTPVVGLDGLRAACAASTVPVVASGGLDPQRASAALSAGATAAAMIGAVLHGDLVANVHAAMEGCASR